MGFIFSKQLKEETQELEKRKYLIDEFPELIESISLVNLINERRLLYKDIIIKTLDNFSYKYGNSINIKRFCIPIIGGISCGKSTFMNYLLPFHNMLEMGENVTTKFICIIRHKKNITIPEIYNVKIEKRDENGSFNFLENGQNLFNASGLNSNLSLSLLDIIKKKNQKIKENENSKEYIMIQKIFF